MFRKGSRWVIALVAAGTLARLYTADVAWRRMLATRDEMEQAVDGLDTLRPVLHGEPLEGLAFHEYERAVELLSEEAHDDWLAVGRADHDGEPGIDARRDALLEENAGALAALGRGARSLDARFAVSWEDVSGIAFPRLMKYRVVANLSNLAAARHLEEGRPELAVDAVLDDLQLGRDLMESPFQINEMVGAALISIAARGGLLDGGLLERLPASELGRLADSLGTLDDGLAPISRAWEGELALLARVASGPRFERRWWPAGSFSGWQAVAYGFSERAYLADYVERARSRRDVMRGLDGAPWSERREAFGRLAEDALAAERSCFVADSASFGVWLSAETARRDTIAFLRVVRAAVEYRTRGRVTPLADPYGSQLTVVRRGDRLRIASAGREELPTPDYLAIELAL